MAEDSSSGTKVAEVNNNWRKSSNNYNGSNQCDQKKSPNVDKSCLKMVDFNTFTKIA